MQFIEIVGNANVNNISKGFYIPSVNFQVLKTYISTCIKRFQVYDKIIDLDFNQSLIINRIVLFSIFSAKHNQNFNNVGMDNILLIYLHSTQLISRLLITEQLIIISVYSGNTFF